MSFVCGTSMPSCGALRPNAHGPGCTSQLCCRCLQLRRSRRRQTLLLRRRQTLRLRQRQTHKPPRSRLRRWPHRRSRLRRRPQRSLRGLQRSRKRCAAVVELNGARAHSGRTACIRLAGDDNPHMLGSRALSRACHGGGGQAHHRHCGHNQRCCSEAERAEESLCRGGSGCEGSH